MPSKRSAMAMLSSRLHAHLRKLEDDNDVLVALQQAMQRQYNALVMEELQLASIYRGLEDQRVKHIHKTSHPKKESSGGHTDLKSATLKRGKISKSAKNSSCTDHKVGKQGKRKDRTDESAGQWVLDEPMDLNLQNKMELHKVITSTAVEEEEEEEEDV